MSTETTKKASLTISERVAGLSILNAAKGDMLTVSAVLKDIDSFQVSKSEWEKAGREEKKLGDQIQWTWDDKKGGLKELVLQEKTVEYILADIARRDAAKEITLRDKALLSLKEKLS